jgi:ribosomal protein S27E
MSKMVSSINFNIFCRECGNNQCYFLYEESGRVSLNCGNKFCKSHRQDILVDKSPTLQEGWFFKT